MILCKILNESSSEVPGLVSSKFGMKHAGIDLEAMSAIAKAAKVRSLEDFKAAVAKYEQYLKSDDLISHHLDLLYDKMLEANLLKIVHPFRYAFYACSIHTRNKVLSCVEIKHVAKLINLPAETVSLFFLIQVLATDGGVGGSQVVPDDPGSEVLWHPGSGSWSSDHL